MSDVEGLLRELRAWYRSDQDDIIEEFYTPCLEVADAYDRAVGFFSSKLLPFLTRGLWRLIERDGRMRLVCSPRLSPADAEAILRGYARRAEAIHDALRTEINRAAFESLEAVEMLAWMVGEGLLDIRLAVPKTQTGIYHEKFGLFSREGHDFAAFTGSPNETEQGVLWNFEQIAVFVAGTGDAREAQRVADLRAAFSSLWDGDTPGLDVMPFPEAARKDLLKYRPPAAPKPGAREVTLRAQLFPHQVEAIHRWQAAGHRGILEMATGTGKTLTALGAVLPFAERGDLVIVLVPGVELAHQWAAVIERSISGAAVQVCGAGEPWPLGLARFLQRWRLLAMRPGITSRRKAHFVVATMDTAAGEAFRTQLRSTDDRSILIIDEVHRVGSPFRRRCLELGPSKRLGLSATPERQWDPTGNRVIAEGVGPVVYRFPLEEAVGRFLSEYEYRPSLISLEPDERQAYQSLSEEIRDTIQTLATRHPEARGDLGALLEVCTPDEAQRLELLLFRRADVLKEARRKIALVHELARDPTIRRCLIYCNDEGHVERVRQALSSTSRSFAVFTSARLGHAERKTALRDFEEGIVDFLVTIRCLDEGVDIPGATHALILASSASDREFIQRRGRILRMAPDKRYSVIHDPIVIPVMLDEDGRPMSAIEPHEQGIIAKELHRAELFAKCARNAVDAMGFLHRVRTLVKEAAPDS
jgi:superfamily II DNA or RNA helicase